MYANVTGRVGETIDDSRIKARMASYGEEMKMSASTVQRTKVQCNLSRFRNGLALGNRSSVTVITTISNHSRAIVRQVER
mmetsp:Transcript_2370/g.3435  ORF Transcript_2370/g.3435 Transcript_2370/m.3435 type:complete len:80 (-) Transcript_2370:89-328(-)